MAPQSSVNSFKAALLFTLPILSLVGAFGTWVLGFSNGMFVGIGDLLETKFPLLPVRSSSDWHAVMLRGGLEARWYF